MFVWRDCTTAQAHVRVTGGGQSAAFTGSIGSSQGFVTVTRFLLESNDVLDATSDPDSISYRMNVSGNGIDGIDFESAAGASVCVDLSAPAVPVYAGADRHSCPYLSTCRRSAPVPRRSPSCRWTTRRPRKTPGC